MSGQSKIHIWRGEPLPPSLAKLQDVARREGFDHIDRLEAECFGPDAVFTPPPACLGMIFLDHDVIGIGGMTRDPYDPAPNRLRMRHFYIHPEHRREGHAGTLAQALIASLPAGIQHLTLFTHPASSSFWEAQGFYVAKGAPSRSHERYLDHASRRSGIAAGAPIS